MNLSVRIFIWFWFSVLLVAVVTFAWARSDFGSPVSLTKEQEAFVSNQVERLQAYGEKRKGHQVLPMFERRSGRQGGANWWLYEHRTERFLNKRLPPELEDQVTEILAYDEPVLFRAGPRWVIGPVHANWMGGGRTLFIGLSHKMTRNLHWQQLIRNTPFLLAGILLVLAIMSYLVARQIARPLESIRHTAEQIANGDFKATVEARLLNRKDEIGSLSRTTSKMGLAIDNALEAHKRLLSDVSHELRSPLTRLSLANTLMTKRQGSTPENVRIEREVAELNGMIEQLLSLSRMQLSAEKEREPVDIRAVLMHCIADAEFSYPKLTLELNEACCGNSQTWATGREELFGSAVQNVLNNAARYCQQHIQVNLSEQEKHWCIRFEDDGPGVPEEELDKIFVPFYRPEFARQRDKGGTGLGLAIVEQAIQFHGGHVMAAHSPLGGLSIIMELPKAEPASG